MRLQDLIRAAISGLAQHKLRTFLTLIGVILGSLLLFVSLCGGLGVIRAMNERLSAGNRLREIQVTSGVQSGNVTEQAAIAAGFTEEMSAERRVRLARAAGVGGKRPVLLTIRQLRQLKEVPGVADAWPVLIFRATAGAPNERWNSVDVATLPTEHADFQKLLVAGGPIDDEGMAWVSESYLYAAGYRTDSQVVDAVGQSIVIATRSTALEQAHVQLVPVGKSERQALIKKLPYKSKPIKIAGVFRRPTSDELQRNPNLHITKRSILVRQSDGMDMWTGMRQGSRPIMVRLIADRPENVKSIEASVSQIGFQTQSLSELAIQIRTAVFVITAIIIAIAASALMISALGITNTMVMSVTQRRKDIAIMKSVGARDRDIRRMFLTEGALLGLFGGMIGLGIGWAMTHTLGGYIRALLEQRLNEKFYSDIFLYPAWLIIGTPVIAAVVTTLATAIPANTAARIDPAQTLRGL